MERKPAYRELVLLVVALGEQFAHAKGHRDELFVFVGEPMVPADNNLAERSLRPLVVSRKISGGTRSQQGTSTRMTLSSLFQTWIAQGRNPLVECRQFLQSPFPQL